MSLFDDLFALEEEPPKQKTTIEYTQKNGDVILVTLVGSSPLYGHILTNACKSLARQLENNPQLVAGRTVLEFGAGGALPSLLSAKLGAKKVLATDYPDPDLVSNIQHNIEQNKLPNCTAKGYIWGNDVEELMQELPQGHKTFDVLLLSDVIFNHTEQRKLLQSCKLLVTPRTGRVFVPFSPHRPKLLAADLNFFELAQEYGFEVHDEGIEMWSPLFKDDQDKATAELRSRVYKYSMTLVRGVDDS
ncbi:hypothetical protein KL905_002266 [Ogataea polymorpha]|nr:hypothetical protein KL908_002660 [Ogataea polymorpha]KAG7905582.1 hypothetical protein KL907_002729 [Ogataea polymorpha]KAG7917003.1 hypothetical protein KL927_002777 [Ogataea polymorpha]KAG7922244.1 hypothetical protein KL905_002266 [Ogataea polymorpha]